MWPLRFASRLPNWTINDEVIDDAVAAIIFLSKRKEVSEIFIVGHSEGAMLAPRIARASAKRGITTSGVVLLAAPLTPLHRLFFEQMEARVDREKLTGASEMLADARQRAANVEKLISSSSDKYIAGSLPFDWPASAWRDLGRYDPADALLAQPSLPALLVFAGRDFQVSISEKAFWETKVSTRPNTDLQVFPSLNHLLIEGEGVSIPLEYSKPGRVSEKLIDEVASWICSRSR